MAGAERRPLVETLRDGLSWRTANARDDNRRAGLSAADELELLAALES